MKCIRPLSLVGSLIFASLCNAQTATQTSVSLSYTREVAEEYPSIVQAEQDFMLTMTDDATRQWMAAEMFSDYWHYRDTLAMIHGMHTAALNVVQHVLNTFEAAIKDKNLSHEEHADICATELAKMFGFKDFNQMQNVFARAAQHKNSGESFAVDECDTVASPVTFLASSKLGSALLAIIDLYHIALVRLSKQADSQTNMTAQEISQHIEMDLFSIILSNSPVISEDTSNIIEQAKNCADTIITAIHDTLLNHLKEVYQPVLFVAFNIAQQHPDRSLENLSFLDFKTYLNDGIATIQAQAFCEEDGNDEGELDCFDEDGYNGDEDDDSYSQGELILN